mmetsp:Transcript_18673/g.46477  ORF Transcript_18673/g.46477 Transcript_18673/m.46477 type:complete len:205 (-) Transcript_18673:1709-2323(-)
MALRHRSQSEPAECSATFCCFMMSSSCARTSRPFLSPLPWMKWRLHQSVRYPLFFHCWYTLNSVMWSLSGTKNFSRAASLSSSRSLGRNQMGGTDSMAITVRISLEHLSSSALSSICASGGSTGNSTILAPILVSPPVLSRAPRIHNWYMLFRMLSCGGGSMKSKSSRLSTLSDLSSSTTLPRLVRWISGTVMLSISCLKAISV